MGGALNGLNASIKLVGKCSHGGAIDLTVDTDASDGGINKDTFDSDHGHLYNIAAVVSYNATKQIWYEFWSTIGNERFGQFLGLSSDFPNRRSGSLILVIDTSTSMGPYIEMIERIATQIASISQIADYPPRNYILPLFNDPNFGPLTVTTKAEKFINAARNLKTKDVGDGPELCYHGIIEALKKYETGSQMYVFTDAPAKDAYLKSLSIKLAREKQVVTTLFYGRGDYQEKTSDPSDRFINENIEYLDSTSSDGFSRLTGGVTMGIDTETLNCTENRIVKRLNMRQQQQRNYLAQNLKDSFDFDVDPTMKSLRIEVTSTGPLRVGDIELTKSLGDKVLPTLKYAMPFVRIYAILLASGENGEWALHFMMAGEQTIELNAVHEVHCSSALQKRIDRSFSVLGFTPLTIHPVKGQTDLFILTVCQNLPATLETGYVSLIDEYQESNPHQTLPPVVISSTGFISNVTMPNFSFYLSAVVRLIDGTTLQRQQKQVIKPMSLSVTINR